MGIVRVKLFFSFTFAGTEYPCALVEWFCRVGRAPDEVTGMWVVEPEIYGHRRKAIVSVLHLDCFIRGVHLIPVFGKSFLPSNFFHRWSLDCFKAFYVNKYADHHSNEILHI